jgi:hypothetical protein
LAKHVASTHNEVLITNQLLVCFVMLAWTLYCILILGQCTHVGNNFLGYCIFCCKSFELVLCEILSDTTRINILQFFL